VRAPFAWLLTMVVAGCFTPNLGDGSVACGANGLCPPKYFCHASDQRCYKTPDSSGVIDMAMPEDGAVGPDLMSTDLAGADLSSCTKALCGARNCGRIPDECGGTETCGGGCPGTKTCGGGNPGSPNICGSGQPCTAKTCQTGQCGLISDGCADVLNCGMCPVGQSCGSDHVCH
jgi:hypothetical protein